MTAIGFLSGDFVRRTGDTMTGDLTINADLAATNLSDPAQATFTSPVGRFPTP